MTILFTFGVNDQNVATIKPDENGMPQIHVDGISRILGLIDLGGAQAQPLLIYGPGAKQPILELKEKPALIFNQISDADRQSVSLERCLELCNRVSVPVINHPKAIQQTTRDGVCELLQGIPGVKVPKTIRCVPRSPSEVFKIAETAALNFPAILRIPGDHNAKSMVLISGPDDVDKLHVFPFDGRTFYLTEFVDYSDSSGIHYKHRIAMVDGEPLSRHVFFDENWIVSSASVSYMKSHPEKGGFGELLDDLERNRVPKANEALREIAKRMQLDYFGIDCHIDSDGKILIFEANSSMSMMSDRIPEISGPVQKIKQQLQHLIRARSGGNVN